MLVIRFAGAKKTTVNDMCGQTLRSTLVTEHAGHASGSGHLSSCPTDEDTCEKSEKYRLLFAAEADSEFEDCELLGQGAYGMVHKVQDKADDINIYLQEAKNKI